MLRKKRKTLTLPKDLDAIFKDAMVVGNFEGAGVIKRDLLPKRRPKPKKVAPPISSSDELSFVSDSPSNSPASVPQQQGVSSGTNSLELPSDLLDLALPQDMSGGVPDSQIPADLLNLAMPEDMSTSAPQQNSNTLDLPADMMANTAPQQDSNTLDLPVDMMANTAPQQDSNIFGTSADIASGPQASAELNSLDSQMPANLLDTPQSQQAPADVSPSLNIDFLKVPDMATQEPSDLLNFSVTSDSSGFDGSSTMELDIRSTSLYKKKEMSGARQIINDRLAAQAKTLSLLESIFVLKHAMSFDFVSEEDSRSILSEGYQQSAQGENPASMMVRGGFITAFQYQTLLENLDKDREAGRLKRPIDVSTQAKAEIFLGMGGEKRVVVIRCPHCRAGFRIRVSVKGGKFKCGKCKEYFFLRGN